MILHMFGILSILPGSIGNFRFLKIITIVIPVLLILILGILRHLFFEKIHPLILDGLLLCVVIIFAVFFSRFVFKSMARIQEDYKQRNWELNILNEIALTVNESLDLNVMLPGTMQKLNQVTRADSGDLFLIDERSRELLYSLHVGISAEASKLDPDLLMNGGLTGEVFHPDEVVIIQDMRNYENVFTAPLVAAGFRSLALVPIKSKNGNMGVLGLLSLKPEHFKLNEARLFNSISNLIAVAVENARRYEKVQAMAVAEERDRISKELHDGLAQVLGFVITKSQATRQILRKMAVANDYLVELENVAQEVYTDTREDILGLRTAISGDRDMISSLRGYLKRYSQMYGIKATLEVGDQIVPSLSPQVELQAIRIMQEALSNIRKHAEATHALVRVTANLNEVTLIIEDDGKGFDTRTLGQNDFSKFGIRTSRERAESIHSRLDIESIPEHGTKVTLSIPLNFPQSSAERGEEIENTDS